MAQYWKAIAIPGKKTPKEVSKQNKLGFKFKLLKNPKFIVIDKKIQNNNDTKKHKIIINEILIITLKTIQKILTPRLLEKLLSVP